MGKLTSLALAAALAAPLALPVAFALPRAARADDKKPEKIANLEEHLSKLEEWTKGDVVKRLELLRKLAEQEKTITAAQRRAMGQRAILEHLRTAGIDKDLVKKVEWLGAQKRDFKGAVHAALGPSGTGVLDDLIETYGTERLYKDEAFQKGDIPAKLKRLKELWTARELHQSTTYSLGDDLVYRYLIPAGGKIDEELRLFGELYRKDVLVWDSTAAIHRALLHRALFEKPELDTTWKRLEWIGKVSADKSGDIAWMAVGSLRADLLIQAVDGDPEFTKLDAAGRKAKIDEWVKAGYVSASDRGTLLAAYASEK